MEKQKILERRLKAVASGPRLRILRKLKRHGAMSTTDIGRAVELSAEAVSQHLSKLLAVDIVVRRQRGIYAMYRLSLEQNTIVRYVLSQL